MSNKRINGIIAGTLITLTLSLVSVVPAFAGTTIPYKEAYGQKSVNVVDLAKAMKAEIKQNGKGIEIFMNGKGLTVYPDHKYVYVNGNLTPLKTEKVKDYDTGVEFDFPIGETPTKDGEGYLIPMNILETHFGIKGTEEGISVETPKQVKDETSNGGQNQGGGNSNDGGNSGEGTTPTAPTGEGGTTTPKTPPSGGGTVPTVPTTPQPVAPTPQPVAPTPKPVTPTPPPVAPKPSGLTPQQIEGRLAGLGLSFDANSSGYGINVYSNSTMTVAIDGQNCIELQLWGNTASSAGVTKQILNLALPTAGGEVYNIISKPFSSQTINRDGKNIDLFVGQQSVVVTIYY